MKVYVDLTENELRALRSAIWNGIGACSGSCIYTEMQTKKTDCNNCAYVKALDSLRKKFSKPKSLADYTKQVRKEVCERLDKRIHNYLSNKYRYAESLDVNSIIKQVMKEDLDQIQGEDK